MAGMKLLKCVFICICFGLEAESATLVVRPGEVPIETVFEQAQNGDEIRLFRGTYEITPGYPADCCGDYRAPLKLIGKTNITVRGMDDGVEIYGAGRGEFVHIERSSGIRFQNITFRGNKPRVEGDSLFSMIMLREANEKLTFENCRFIDFGNHAISQLWGVKLSTDVVVRNCYFYNGGDIRDGSYDGAAVSGIGSRWLIESNLVEKCIIGFEIEGPWGVSHDTVIRKNTLLNTGAIGITLFATSGRSEDYKNIEISDNVIKDTEWVFTETYPPTAMLIGGGENIRVLRNRIENCANTAIQLSTTWADLRDCVVEGNTIDGTKFSGIHVYDFEPHTSSNIVIRGNAITNTGHSGILVAGKATEVTGNIVQNVGWSGEYAGIEVDDSWAGTERVLISGNTIENVDSNSQDYGVWVREGVAGVRIAPNKFRNNQIRAIFDEGKGTVIETRIVAATHPTWVLGSKVDIFTLPNSKGHLQTSDNLVDWFSVYEFTANENGEAAVIVTADMIMILRRFYRAALLDEVLRNQAHPYLLTPPPPR